MENMIVINNRQYMGIDEAEKSATRVYERQRSRKLSSVLRK